MKRPLSILFFPIDIGIAHIVRPYAIAEELQKRGHRVLMALPKRKHHIVSQGTVPIVDIGSYVEDDFNIKVKSFSNIHFLKKLVDQEIDLITKYDADVVVSDFRLSALAAGLITGKKSFCITNGDGIPHGSYIPNPGFPKLIYQAGLPFVQKLFDKGTQIYLKNLLKIVRNSGIQITFHEWFHAIHIIVPEPSFFLPPVDTSLQIHYVGPLHWSKFSYSSPAWMNDIIPNGKTIYLSFGGTGFAKEKLISIAVELVRSHFRVVVTTGTICDPSDFPSVSNLYVAKYLSAEIICKKVDLVICHGGYGTMISAVKEGKPVLAIPFNPDQVVHSTRMQELGVGKTLLTLNLLDIKDILTLNWKAIEDKGKNIPVQIVVNAVDEMMRNISTYQKAISEFNSRYPQTDGAKEAADVIERIMDEA